MSAVASKLWKATHIFWVAGLATNGTWYEGGLIVASMGRLLYRERWIGCTTVL